MGIDADWAVTRAREARYPSLPAGDYRFEVQCRSASAGWSRAPGVFEFTVLKRWWERWTARAGFTIALLAVAAAFFWIIRRQARRRERWLTRAVASRTHEALLARIEPILASATGVAQVSRDMAGVVSRLAESSAQVSASVGETREIVAELTTLGQITAETAGRIQANAQVVVSTSASGSGLVARTRTLIDRILADSSALSTRAEHLGRELAEVDAITGSVQAIADKSTVISINASIEAASAGKAGKGFAVVAKEMQELAKESKAATTHVTERLRDIRRALTEIDETLKNEIAVSEGGVETIQRSGLLLGEMTEAMRHDATSAAAIGRDVRQQVEALDRIEKAVKTIGTAAADNGEICGELERYADRLDSAAGQLNELIEDWRGNTAAAVSAPYRPTLGF